MAFSLVFYNAILLLSTLFVWLSEKASTPMQRKVCTLIAFLIVFLPAALRYEIGIDYFSYKIIFENIRDGLDPFWQSKMEPGYYFLNWVVANLGLSFEWLVALVAFFIALFFFIGYPKKKAYLWHFLIIALFYFTSFNYLRSWLALSIAWFALGKYFNNGRVLPVSALLLFSALFHKAAILLLPFVLINNKFFIFNQRVFTTLSLVLIGMVFVFKAQVIGFLFNNAVSDLLGFSRYANSAWNRPTELGSGMGVLVKILFLITPLFYIKRMRLSGHQKRFFIMFLAASAAFLLLSSIVDIFNRVEKVFAYGFLLSFMLYVTQRTIKFRAAFIIGFLFLVIYDFNGYILRGSTDYRETCRGARITPYVSVFNKVDSKRDPHLTRYAHWCDAYFENK